MRNHSNYLTRTKQSGVVLVIALVVLVAMTMAAIALVRSVDTTNIIAGNLAFRQSATHAADAGIDDALYVLLPSLVAANQLNVATCPAGFGYLSFHQPNLDPPNQTWDQFWTSMGTCPKTMSQNTNGDTLNAAGRIVALSSTIQYVVESMCSLNGQAGTCSTPPPSAITSCSGSDVGGATQKCMAVNRKYYRVTTRVQGPRNTISYIQAIVAM